MKIKKIIIKAKLFPDSSTPLTLGARQLLLRSKNELFSPFFPDCSVIAKSLAHLRLSWLYLIYLIAKCISFLQKKDESSKFSSIITCGFEAQFVASPNQYLGGMGSNPVRASICFLQSTFLQLVKLQLTCEDHV